MNRFPGASAPSATRNESARGKRIYLARLNRYDECRVRPRTNRGSHDFHASISAGKTKSKRFKREREREDLLRLGRWQICGVTVLVARVVVL